MKDYAEVQALFHAFHNVPFRLIAGLPDRQAYMGFQKVSDPRLRGLAFPVHLRPTATWAGGETITVK